MRVSTQIELMRKVRRESLVGYSCPFCVARGVYSELEYRPEHGDNICAACQETLIAE